MMNRSLAKTHLILPLMTACVLTTSLFAVDEEEARAVVVITPEQAQVGGIEVRQAAPVSLEITVNTPSKIILNADAHAHVVPKIPGIVVSTKKNLGDPVREGDILAVLESREVAEAKSAYLTATREFQLQKELLEREKNLHDKHISPEQDYLQASASMTNSEITLELAKQKLLSLGLNNEDILAVSLDRPEELRTYTLKAPLKGVIIDKDLSLGEWIDSNREAYTLANLDTVWVEMEISGKDLPSIKKGQKIGVSTLSNSQQGEATIQYLSPVIDEHTRTATAIAFLDNKDHLWLPGTYVCACVTVDTFHVAVGVPKDAVQIIEDEPCVFVQCEQGFEKRLVTLGKSDEHSFEIVAGLELGVPYAASGTFLLKADLGKESAKED